MESFSDFPLILLILQTKNPAEKSLGFAFVEKKHLSKSRYFKHISPFSLPALQQVFQPVAENFTNPRPEAVAKFPYWRPT